MPSDEVTIELIGVAGSVIVLMLGGLGWLIRQAFTSSKKTPDVSVTQGQPIGTGETEWLRAEIARERKEHAEEIARRRVEAAAGQARERAYRDELLRLDVDPDAVLRDVGLL